MVSSREVHHSHNILYILYLLYGSVIMVDLVINYCIICPEYFSKSASVVCVCNMLANSTN